MENNIDWNIPKYYKKIYSCGLSGKHINNSKDETYAARLSNILSKLSEETYKEYFHYLLWFEETKERETLQKQSVASVKLQNTSSATKYTVLVPGLEQKQRYVRTGEMVLLISNSNKLLAEINDIDVAKNKLTINFKKLLRLSVTEKFKLIFVFSSYQYDCMHNAIEGIKRGVHINKVFPKKVIKCDTRKTKPIITWFNNQIANNNEQRAAVEHIVAKSSGNAPYILHGPPGTGKTATIVEAILQVLQMDISNKVMVCAPSNSAADDVACKLIKYESEFPFKIFLLRRNSSKRDWVTLPVSLKKYAKDPFARDTTTSYEEQITSALRRTRVIVSTIGYAPNAARKLPFITHLFIDEAAQATEPQCLVPIKSLLVPEGLLVLSGDPLQLGPVLSSPFAKKYGLGTSLMERLMQDKVYTTNNANYTIMLKKNYRSHADILDVPNAQFYKGQLKACAAEDVISRRNILNGGQGSRAIVFHAVFGQEAQEKQCSSYFNEMELNTLKLYVRKLTAGNYKEDTKNIGIITPYTAQVKKIKDWLDSKGLKEIEVGSVESFQGREKKIILLSTVRGQGNDSRKQMKLGFLSDFKRFNVALTRAKAKLIVIGNPNCLMTDKMWRIYIEKCKEFGSYNEVSITDYLETENLLKTTRRLQTLKIR